MKYYKVITPQDYNPEEIGTYLSIGWQKVPQEILNLAGTIFTVYGSTEPFESNMIVLAKPCRQKKTTTGYPVSSDITLYL